MKEYNIYIDRRPKEGSLFIYSLQFRDVFSAHNKLILNAILGNYTLRKMICVENKAELDAVMGDVLCTVGETAGFDTEMRTNANFSAIYGNELEPAFIGIDTSQLYIIKKYPFEAVNDIGVYISNVDAEMNSSLGNTEHTILIATSEPDSLAQKHLGFSDHVNILFSSAEMIILHFCGSDQMHINCSVSAAIGRYRLLRDIDHEAFSGIDKMTLYEMDYMLEE